MNWLPCILGVWERQNSYTKVITGSLVRIVCRGLSWTDSVFFLQTQEFAREDVNAKKRAKLRERAPGRDRGRQRVGRRESEVHLRMSFI